MANIPLIPTDIERQVAKEPQISLLNRFAERNPALSEEPVAVIARPALKKFVTVGDGPVRKLYNQPGTFDDDLFAVSGLNLFRITNQGVDTDIGVIGTDTIGSVSMAATAPIGDTVPAYLFIADGGVLWFYTENGSAVGHLQASGAIANNDVIVLNGVYYQWTNGAVDTGTPAGTVGSPWLVKLGVSNILSLTSMFHAINLSGEPGVDYSTVTTENPYVAGASVSANDLYVIAKVAGTAGNAYTTTETGANISWGGATMSGGGDAQLRQVQMPEDYGAISVAVINSYVIVIPVQEETIKGRFYWIEPGEVTVDPLNFATAERSPDGLHQVVVFGDFFWLLGQKTTEPWQTTGNPDAPMQRFQGILFDRGSWEGTAIQIKDSLFVVDEDGGVFQINQGQRRVSQGRPDIEERIRRAMQQQESA